MTTQSQTDDVELTETGAQMMATADALDDLATELRDAESIAEDVPVLSDLFHKARTSKNRSRDGKYVALLDFDHESGDWSCRTVSWLQQGAHYRDTGADTLVSFSPYPFLEVDEFADHVAASLERDAQAARQNAYNHRKAPADSRDYL